MKSEAFSYIQGEDKVLALQLKMETLAESLEDEEENDEIELEMAEEEEVCICPWCLVFSSSILNNEHFQSPSN